MLLWMICTNELTPYFLKGKSIARCYGLGAVVQGLDPQVPMDEARTSVRERFTPELAEEILEAKAGNYVETLAYEWDESDEGPLAGFTGILLKSKKY